MTVTQFRETALRNQSRRRGAQLAIAAAIYLRKKGELPPDLGQLAAANVIHSLPLDPLVDKPFIYAARERQIRLPSAPADQLTDPDFEGSAYWSVSPRGGDPG